MVKFRLVVYYAGVESYTSSAFDYADVIALLNDIVDSVYDLNSKFGDCFFRARDFSYSIEEVE